MKISGTLTEEDYAAAARFPRFVQIALLVLLFPLDVLLPWKYPLPFGSILFAVAWAALLLAWVRAWRSSSGKPPRLQQTLEPQGPCEFDITPERLIIIGARSINTEWRERFSGYRVSRRGIILRDYFGGIEIFPRRWFTDEQYAEFLALLCTAFKSRVWS